MSKLKKIFAVGLACAFIGSFAACSKNNIDQDVLNTASSVKTGYAVISAISDVKDTTLTIDSVCAAVLVDANGKIVDCKIDEAQTKPDLADNAGNVEDLRTKLEKQSDYNMKYASEIGKEWYEQIAAFEAYAKGKTADEIAAAVGADGYAADADLKAGCTMHITDIAKAVAFAAANAQELGASATDTLKLKVLTEKAYSSNETNLQYDTDYAVVTIDADGKITSCLVDESQAKCSIDDGKFTVAEGAYITKKEIKDGYNMKPASEIGKEWYEQAAAFEAFAKGKTAAQITAAVGEEGIAADTDLKAGCTMNVSSIARAVASAATV